MPGSKETRPEGFDPLGMAGAKEAARYANAAAKAHSQPLQAIKLKCLDCCGWEYAVAKGCEIRTCPLWKQNRRAFGTRGPCNAP